MRLDAGVISIVGNGLLPSPIKEKKKRNHPASGKIMAPSVLHFEQGRGLLLSLLLSSPLQLLLLLLLLSPLWLPGVIIIIPSRRLSLLSPHSVAVPCPLCIRHLTPVCCPSLLSCVCHYALNPCVSLVTWQHQGDMECTWAWHCQQSSTHNPPHEQWLVRLKVGVVSVRIYIKSKKQTRY